MNRIVKKALWYLGAIVLVSFIVPFAGLMFTYFSIGVFLLTEVIRINKKDKIHIIPLYSLVIIYFLPLVDFGIRYVWVEALCMLDGGVKIYEKNVSAGGYFYEPPWSGCGPDCVNYLLAGYFDYLEY